MQKNLKTCVHAVVAFLCFTTMSACGSSSGNDDSSATGTSGASISSDSANNLSMVCTTIINLESGMNIKYKSQNVHGGRGPSFILGCEPNAKRYWPVSSYLATFPMYSSKGNEIGRFTVFDPGHHAYGNRSYSGLPGGYPSESETLLQSAMADGSPEFYVNVRENICFKVENPTVDQGTIVPVQGSGPC